MRFTFVVIGKTALWLVLSGMTAWGILAIYFSYLPEPLRPILSTLFALCQLAILFFLHPKGLAYAVFSGLFVIVLLGWLSMKPSNHRDWQADVACLPYAEIDGNRVTVHNIRNCDYRTETDYTVRYYDKTFDISKLDHIDLYLVNWGIKYISHTMISFGFQGDDYLCISIEPGRKRGKATRPSKGSFGNMN